MLVVLVVVGVRQAFEAIYLDKVKIERLLEGRSPGSDLVGRGGGGTDDVRRAVDSNDEVLGACATLGELIAGDVDHMVGSVGVNVGESVLTNGGDEFLAEVDPDLTNRVLSGLLDVNNEIRGSLGERDVVVDELTRANDTGGGLSSQRQV